jgi:cell division protein FtsB
MPVAGHDERTAVRVSKLNRDIEVREAELEKLRRAEMP